MGLCRTLLNEQVLSARKKGCTWRVMSVQPGGGGNEDCLEVECDLPFIARMTSVFAT